MSNLTQHVEQLAKKMSQRSSENEGPDYTNIQAALLMTAMAKETEAGRRSRDADKAYEAADVGIEQDEFEKLYTEQVSARMAWDEARRELNALIPKEPA